MADAQGIGSNGPNEEGLRPPAPQEPRPRAVGSPLPVGGWSPAGPPALQPGAQPGPLPGSLSAPPRPADPPPRARALAHSAAQGPTGVQRAVSVLRVALPFVQRILPLLDGNIGTAVSNLLAPHHHAPPTPPPPPPPVDLAPLENGLAELQTQQRELRDQVVEQNSSLKRVEDQLEMVREATDRNTLEQQELVQDLKGVGNKVNLVALIALGLLAVSIAINVVLYLHILKIFP